jgi:RNA polymerase sigma-70 factor, ECF subfamily
MPTPQADALWHELKRAAYGLTKNRADAEDIVQSAFVRALERRELWQAETNWPAWLHTVVRHLFIDHVRREKRSAQLHDHDVSEVPAPAATAPPPFAEITSDQLARAVLACDWIFREVYHLHYEQGLSYAEIAIRMNVPIGTVSTRLYRARAHIRRELEALPKVRQHNGRMSLRRIERSVVNTFSIPIRREQFAMRPSYLGQAMLPRPHSEKGMTMKIKKIEQTKEISAQPKSKDAAGVQVKTDIKAGAARLVAVCG